MPGLKATLGRKLKTASRVAFLGIGSELRADDAAGLAVCAAVEAAIRRRGLRGVKVFYGHTAPENVTGQIRRFSPSHTVIVDAADFGRPPGAVSVIDFAATEGVSCSTHRLPVELFADYLSRSLGSASVFIGIQPASLAFGGALSGQVRRAVAAVSSACIASLGSLGQGSTGVARGTKRRST